MWLERQVTAGNLNPVVSRWKKRVSVPVAFFLFAAVFLFSEFSLSALAPPWIQTLAREIQTACRDAGTQWMVVTCLVVYLVTFQVLSKRAGIPESKAARWFLFGLVGLALARYAFAYSTAAGSLQFPVLVAGIVFGKAIAFFCLKSKVLSPKSGTRQISISSILVFLLLLLAACALWQPKVGMEFKYRGVTRWSGAWSNPNTYGLLMGTGVVLAVGLMGLRLKPTERHLTPALSPDEAERVNESGSRKNAENTKLRLSLYAMFAPFRGYGIFLVLAASLCGSGLLKSYSRGAWLGTAVALGFLVWKIVHRETHVTREPLLPNDAPLPSLSPLSQDTPHPACGHLLPSAEKGTDEERVAARPGEEQSAAVLLSCGSCISWLKRNLVPLCGISLSLAVIGFWLFRHTELPVARRVFSVANVNDFSWRNRVTAWNGSLRMVADHPFFGVGWGQVERTFAERYQDERLAEAMAVQLNDYFTLANSAGLPALICFLAYVGVALTRNPEHRMRDGVIGFAVASPGTCHPSLASVCHAVVVLLLIGFWFDGGLFKLPLAVVFWTMLELARVSSAATPLPSLSPPSGERVAERPGEGNSAVTGSVGSRALRWSAAILLAGAAGLSAFHLLLPRMMITDRTLSLARRHSIQPSAREDFDFVAALPLWQGQRVKTLLEHVELAHYNRTLVNWQVSDEMYRDAILNPGLGAGATNQLHWRRELWEYFYPRIRKEPSAESAAESVIDQLRERVKIPATAFAELGLERAWSSKQASEAEFQLLCVAALRAVGVPARLTQHGEAEFYTGRQWRVGAAPGREPG